MHLLRKSCDGHLLYPGSGRILAGDPAAAVSDGIIQEELQRSMLFFRLHFVLAYRKSTFVLLNTYRLKMRNLQEKKLGILTEKVTYQCENLFS